MSPLRLVILVILFYIAYRLIFSGRKKVAPGQKKQKKSGKIMPLHDILEEDPVCSKLVPRQQAVQYKHNGKKHYFCSQECCDTFRSEQGEK